MHLHARMNCRDMSAVALPASFIIYSTENF